MALINYSIQLSSTPVSSGPLYDVFYSSDCSSYTLAGQVNLPTTESIELVQVDDSFTCIKLQSAGNCFNNVVSGSSPSTSFYNTKLVELTYKGTTGPTYDMDYSTDGVTYTPMYPITLDNIGDTESVEFPSGSVAMRLTAGPPCDTEVVKPFVPVITPTATPVPTATPIQPTPTPSPTSVPFPTPTPTPTATGVPVTPTATPVPSTYYARFVTCDDPTGLIIQIQSSSPINTSVVIKDNLECFNYLGEGGTGVDGDINTFEQFISCADCLNDVPVTPTATPVPTPLCTQQALFVSLVSAEDAYCTQVTEKIVRHNGNTIANATAIFTDNTCDTLAPSPRWYSDGVNVWYWNGLSLQLIPNPPCP
jgi:hypothetical protein